MVGYWLLPRRLRLWWLLGASLLFYGSWNAAYVPGFLALIGINWWLGLKAAGPHRRAAVWAAVIIDVSLLGVFKYLDWAIGSGASAFRFVTGGEVDLGGFGLVLPLAISFVTFTFIAYIVDVSRGARPERDPLRFAVFVTYFPHLIAGPIMRGREFLPQVRRLRPFSRRYLGDAAPLIISGLLKKSVADMLAPAVAQSFGAPAQQSSAGLLVGALAFTFQLYLDFSGYTDIALGSARLMGFRLPRNFDWPYRATNMADFWSRWHITLGRWLRDYLYFPMGGSRKGELRAYVSLMLTMIICGLWHGAGLTYIAWGFLQGVALSAYRFWKRLPGAPRMTPLLGWIVTFAFVVLVRVIFAADSLEAAGRYYRAMLIPQGGLAPDPWIALACVLGVAAQLPVVERLVREGFPRHSLRRVAAYGAAAALVIVLLPVTTPAFIYFQF